LTNDRQEIEGAEEQKAKELRTRGEGDEERAQRWARKKKGGAVQS